MIIVALDGITKGRDTPAAKVSTDFSVAVAYVEKQNTRINDKLKLNNFFS